MMDLPTAQAHLRGWIGARVTEAFSTLLEKKHLYQSVDVAAGDIVKLLVPQLLFTPQKEGIAQYNDQLLAGSWHVTNLGAQTAESGTRGLHFALPSVKLYCANPKCRRIEPFNPVHGCDVLEAPLGRDFLCQNGTAPVQYFSLSLLCQSCKLLPEVFLVRREALRLTLSGRSPMASVPVPKVIPQGVRHYYSGAMIAHQSGQTLAGLFLLRTCIEQWLKPQFRQAEKVDDLWEPYHATLGEAFTARFPSLRAIYGDLSAAIHNAHPNEQLFEKCCAQFVEHFDARRLFKLVETIAPTGVDGSYSRT